MMKRRKSLETRSLEAFHPPITIYRPETISCPVIFASPHSGRIYPESFQKRSALDDIALRQNEDAFIDELFAVAPEFGAPLLAANFPRCFVDVNRSPDELPKDWRKTAAASTARADMGLGVIPTMMSDTVPIYKKKLNARVRRKRLEKLYHPYHEALQDLVQHSRDMFGKALIVDCHSMPGFAPSGPRRADIVLGDRYGTSCAPDTINKVEALFADKGYGVVRNYPYAGGYVTSHYGKPDEGVETLQIEINRSLYLNTTNYKKKNGFKKLTEDIRSIVESITATDIALPLAAE